MINNKQVIFLIFSLFLSVMTVTAQDEHWRENMKLMIYSPRYFGPNAFPMPELRSGIINNRIELELRGEFHTFKGDQTHDIYGRLFIPIAEGRTGLELNYIFYEYYNMTQETVLERHAAGPTWAEGVRGDLVINTFYKIFGNIKWIDLLVEASLKTTGGKRLSDARYTDAAAYWFDLNTGFHLFRSVNASSFVRLQGLAGFYCWMTNDIIHRQNDAFLYSGGISGRYKNMSMQADLAGFHGYINNGDRPLILRSKLNYEYRKNILSLRYKHGIHDYLYDTYSIAYIRCF